MSEVSCVVEASAHFSQERIDTIAIQTHYNNVLSQPRELDPKSAQEKKSTAIQVLTTLVKQRKINPLIKLGKIAEEEKTSIEEAVLLKKELNADCSCELKNLNQRDSNMKAIVDAFEDNRDTSAEQLDRLEGLVVTLQNLLDEALDYACPDLKDKILDCVAKLYSTSSGRDNGEWLAIDEDDDTNVLALLESINIICFHPTSPKYKMIPL